LKHCRKYPDSYKQCRSKGSNLNFTHQLMHFYI